MIKTLHGYLARDLARVTGLALVAFTLLMTIFAIMEPLRKEGLGAVQALTLMGYTVPIMLSLTLPIAALFAATIVYGRFSQDNELMAARASGISTIALLQPAWVLGAIVTLLSLGLNGFVAPQMARLAETSIKANVRPIVYRQLRTKPYVRYSEYVIHADRVDEAENTIYGLVVAKVKPKDDIALVVAPKAMVSFEDRADGTYLTFVFRNVALARTGNYVIAEAASHPPITQKVPSLASEDPSWYDWGKLLATLENPLENSTVRRFLSETVVSKLYSDMLARQIAKAVATGEPYAGLRDAQYVYEIRAAEAKLIGGGVVELKGAPRGEGYQPVEITIVRDGRPYQLISAEEAQILATESELMDEWFVTIKAVQGVSVLPLDEQRAVPQRRTQWAAGQLPVPADVVAQAQAVPPLEIIRNPAGVTNDPDIIDSITRLKDRTIRDLLNRIKAEMHMRAAYSLSCFLMVAMGAALGLIFRGGQVVSAFALTVIPAALVIVMMLMGKQMVKNPDVSAYWGLATIWLGIIILLAADVVVYLILRRQ